VAVSRRFGLYGTSPKSPMQVRVSCRTESTVTPVPGSRPRSNPSVRPHRSERRRRSGWCDGVTFDLQDASVRGDGPQRGGNPSERTRRIGDSALMRAASRATRPGRRRQPDPRRSLRGFHAFLCSKHSSSFLLHCLLPSWLRFAFRRCRAIPDPLRPSTNGVPWR
jgi:hypothetical protein